MIEAIRQGIYEEMKRDETVFVIGEDIGTYGGAFKLTEGFIDEFGAERMIDQKLGGAVGRAGRPGQLLNQMPIAARHR